MTDIIGECTNTFYNRVTTEKKHGKKDLILRGENTCDRLELSCGK